MTIYNTISNFVNISSYFVNKTNSLKMGIQKLSIIAYRYSINKTYILIKHFNFIHFSINIFLCYMTIHNLTQYFEIVHDYSITLI